MVFPLHRVWDSSYTLSSQIYKQISASGFEDKSRMVHSFLLATEIHGVFQEFIGTENKNNFFYKDFSFSFGKYTQQERKPAFATWAILSD